MRVCVWLLAFAATTAVLLGGETTNLVEILRRFQAELDLREGRTPAAVEPQAPATAAPRVGTVPLTPPDRPGSASSSPAPASRGGYRLQAGDRVKVEVANEPGMSLEDGEVAVDGTIVLPILGPVPLSGKTVKEAGEAIREILARDYLVNPRVQVKLLDEGAWPSVPAAIEVPSAPSAARVTAAGPSSDLLITNQVARPGKYPWPGEELTLRRAIELAGGPTARGDLTRVKVRRLIGGERRELEVNLAQPDEARRGGSLLLKPGDEVEVPARR